MTVRIAQFVRAANDVVDEAFLRDFPEVEAAKADSLDSLAAQDQRTPEVAIRTSLACGERVEIVGIDGLRLRVKPYSKKP